MKSKNKQNQPSDHYELLLKSSIDIITSHDLSGKILSYNGSTGYDICPEDMVGKMPSDLYEEDVSNKIVEVFNRVRHTGKSEKVEVQLDWLGPKKWFLEYVYPLKKTDGKVVEMVKVCKNIHAFKVAKLEVEKQNETLLKGERSYRDILEMSSDFIPVFDSKGKIVFINNASKKFFSLTPEECSGRFIFDFIHLDDTVYTKAKFTAWAVKSK